MSHRYLLSSFFLLSLGKSTCRFQFLQVGIVIPSEDCYLLSLGADFAFVAYKEHFVFLFRVKCKI